MLVDPTTLSYDVFSSEFARMGRITKMIARDKGFYDKPTDDGTRIALMHSELSEALEGIREGNPPDKHIPEFSTAEAELADCVIRIMDFAAFKDMKVGDAIAAKIKYNSTRPYKHGGKEF